MANRKRREAAEQKEVRETNETELSFTTDTELEASQRRLEHRHIEGGFDHIR